MEGKRRQKRLSQGVREKRADTWSKWIFSWSPSIMLMILLIHSDSLWREMSFQGARLTYLTIHIKTDLSLWRKKVQEWICWSCRVDYSWCTLSIHSVTSVWREIRLSPAALGSAWLTKKKNLACFHQNYPAKKLSPSPNLSCRTLLSAEECWLVEHTQSFYFNKLPFNSCTAGYILVNIYGYP